MSCRKCMWLDCKPNAAGVVSPRKDGVYQCKAPAIDITTILPWAVAKATTVERRYVTPDEGANCPAFTRR